MRNKSRKRILHEQRIKIASLEQTVSFLRAEIMMRPRIEKITLKGRFTMPPDIMPHSKEYGDIMEYETEKILRNFVEMLCSKDAIDVTKVETYMQMYPCDAYEITLSVLKPR